MKLEDLVPPLEMCKQIPAGKFDDSAFVWRILRHRGGDMEIKLKRRKKSETVILPLGDVIQYCPAPTVTEMLYQMPGNNDHSIVILSYVARPEKILRAWFRKNGIEVK